MTDLSKVHTSRLNCNEIISKSNTISNCITEIPQNIKLELNNGTLTLKAGSKVYVPNGPDIFNEIVIQSDLTLGSVGTATTDSIIFYNTTLSSLGQGTLYEAISGTTPPSGSGTWYDTTNNLVKLYSSGSDTGRKASLPIAIVHRTTGSWDKIEQVFQGFGYIGSTVFALPGVKGLIPDGRNTDGSLKNTEFTVSNVLTRTADIGSSVTDFSCVVVNGTSLFMPANSSIGTDSSKARYFDYDRNMYIQSSNGQQLMWCKYAVIDISADDSKKISNFKLKTTFHAVDYNDFKSVVDTKAPINSPALTGTPIAPTPATSDNSTKIATTAFVQSKIQLVSALPASPVAGVLYGIAE